jgi:hypothetical protein
MSTDLPAVDRALQEAGLVARHVQISPGFARLIIESGDESTELDRLFELAAQKDQGFTPEMFAEMAGRFSRLRQDEFGLDREQYEQLERKVVEWQERARNR